MKRSGFKPAASKERKPNMRKCKICRTQFPPRSMTHKACTPECAAELVKSDRERLERKDIAKRKAALKKPSEYASNAQDAVNKYVKWRDWGKPCVSCGKPHNFDVTRNASHLKARGSNSFLRFHLWNINMSCVQCNKDKAGNVAEYIPRLAKRIGQDKVDFLLNAPRSREYSIEYYLRINRIFTKKAKRMESRQLNAAALSAALEMWRQD